MERRQLPANSQGDILWIGPEKGLITTWTRATPVNGHGLVWVMLWMTSDGGLTWEKKWSGQGRSLQLEIGVNSTFNYENRTALVQDYQGNIYIHRSNKVIRAYKNGPESWDRFDGFTIPQWPEGFVRAPLVFATGVNQLFILAEIGGKWVELRTKNLTKWDQVIRIDQAASNVRWIRAGFTFNNLPRWLYLNERGGNWVIQLAGYHDNMNAYPSETVYTKAGTTQRIGAVSAVTDSTGKIHVVWTESDTKNIMHIMKIGGAWTDPEIIGQYAGHSVNNLNDTSATAITSGYQVETSYAPYMTIQHDGIGLMVTWAEVTNTPAAAIREFNLKRISFDGTVWGPEELIASEGLTLNTTNSSDVFKYIGPFNNTTNYGIHSIIIRDGIETDDLYFYPLTVPYQPYAPKNLAPANGAASEDLERPLTWTFTDPVPGDSQSAYQIEIVRQSDSELMWDSGKVISSEQTINIPSEAGLVHGVFYQWRVRTWDQSNLEGAWSDYLLFKTSDKPTVAITSPTVDEVLENSQPDIVWTYNDPESLAQIGAQVQIIDPATDGIVYDSEMLATNETTFRIPPNTLLNGGSYIARVRVQDQDGITSDPDDQTFSVQYIAPPAPVVLPSVDEFGGVVLNINSENAANDSWMEDYYKVYRKELGQPDFELIEESVLLPQTAIDDFETTAGWGAGGVAVDPIIVEAKEGTNALGFGTSAAGNSSNTKAAGIINADQFDQAQIWLYTTDKTTFDFVRIRIGTNLANYYYFDIDNEEFENNTWKSFKFGIDSMQLFGSPRRNQVTSFGLEIRGATGALAAGTIRADKLRMLQSNINYYDRYTVIGKQYIYGVSSYSLEGDLESSTYNTQPQLSKFTAPYVNLQLVPMDVEDISIEGFMDASRPPNWSSVTDTEYYHTKGSTKPIAVINAMESYREGSIEIRFFDTRFGGRGLEAAEELELYKNSKPILLRTWWGRNYYISIDGEVNIKRQPGIGWYATFNFTEINP